MSVSPQTGFQEGVHDVDLVGTTVSELQSAQSGRAKSPHQFLSKACVYSNCELYQVKNL